MKKITRILFFAALTLTATGCLDMIEEISLNANGSGTYTSTMNAAELMEQLSSLSAYDSTGQMVPNMSRTLDSTFEVNAIKFKAINGVTAVRLDKSVKNVYKLSLNFKDIDVLNEVLDTDKKADAEKNLYSWSKGKLVRKDGGKGLSNDFLGGDEDSEFMDAYLEDMKYIVIYHFPGAVKNMKNKNATLSDDNKTVTLKLSMSDVRKNMKSLGNEVSYK